MFLFDSLRSDINCEINVIADSVLWRFTVDIVEKNPVLKSQTKPFYIGTKEAPSAKWTIKMQNFDVLINDFVVHFLFNDTFLR